MKIKDYYFDELKESQYEYLPTFEPLCCEEHIGEIRTECVKPPIPTAIFDWSAVHVGYEPGDPIGWGTTEIAAIEDLMRQL